MKTTQLKNVYQNMDHNSLFYYKHLWDSVAPLIFNVALSSPKSASQRHKLAQDLLSLTFDRELPLQTLDDSISLHGAVNYTLDSGFQHDFFEVTKKPQKVLIDFGVHGGDPIRIESNVDRLTELRVYLLKPLSSTQEVTAIDSKNRVYNKGNLISLLLSREQLEEVEQILIVSERRSKSVSMRDIMNLSPTFDKRTPTVWKHEMDPKIYLSITVEKEREVTLLKSSDLVYWNTVQSSGEIIKIEEPEV